MGSLLSTGDLNSTAIRDGVLQEYLNEQESVSVAGQVVAVDNYCSGVVSDEVSFTCLASGDPTLSTSVHGSAVNFAIEIAVGIGAGLFLCLLLALGFLVLCICCSRKEVRKKYKEPKVDDLNIQ